MTEGDLARLERHLAAAHEEADALVDLSNVVRDDRLGGGHHPRSLRRLRLVVDALAARVSDREARFHVVADRSLRRGAGEFPGPAEPSLLGHWAARGLIEEAEDADEPLLGPADVTGLPVISRDDFADFRTSHRSRSERAAGPGPGRSAGAPGTARRGRAVPRDTGEVLLAKTSLAPVSRPPRRCG